MHLLNPVNKSYCLYQICESNYHRLFKLVPHLLTIHGKATACVPGKPSLYIKIIERTPYTITIELSHFFEHRTEPLCEPAVKMRAYLDAKSVEAMADRDRLWIQTDCRNSKIHSEILQYKWTLNYFLEKWLTHCLQLGYRFDQAESLEATLL